jgi:hypothetical protein
VVVVEVELCVDVVSPPDDMLEPVVLEPDELVTVPCESTLDDLWLVVSVETVGDGITGVVTDWVVDELEDELCAKAAPVIREAIIVAASRLLIMSNAPWETGCGRGSLAIQVVE